jgi:hypothetical protein
VTSSVTRSATDLVQPRRRAARLASGPVILEAAATLFLRNGYLGTSVDDIAALAHVSKPRRPHNGLPTSFAARDASSAGSSSRATVAPRARRAGVSEIRAGNLHHGRWLRSPASFPTLAPPSLAQRLRP